MCRIYINDLIGKKFGNKGRGPDVFDCYGLAMEIFDRYGIKIEDQEADALDCEATQDVIDNVIKEGKWKHIKQPVEPCIVAIRNHPCFVSHVGVYIGEGKFIHTRAVGMDSTSGYVCIEKINSNLWAKRIKGFYKYVN